MFAYLLRTLHACLRWPRLVVAAALGLTLASLYQWRDLKVEADFLDLLPSDWESVQEWKRVGKKFGSLGHLAVVVHSPSPRANVEAIRYLAERLKSHPGVNFLEYRTEADFYRKHKLLYITLEDLEEVERRVESGLWYAGARSNPLVQDLLTDEEMAHGFDATSFADLEAKYFHRLKDWLGTADSTTLVMRVYPRTTLTDVHANRAFLADVMTVVDSFRAEDRTAVEFHYSGELLRNIQNEGRLFSSVLRSTRWSLALVGLCLLLGFVRLPFGFLVATLPVGMAVLWTLGLAAPLLGALGLTTAPLSLLLFGIGLPAAIHLLARYSEERRKRLSAAIAFETILLETGPALATGLLVLTGAFLGLTTASFKGISDFGWLAAAGMLANAVAVLLVLPALLTLAEPYGWLRPFGKRLYNPLRLPPTPPALWKGARWTVAGLTLLLLARGPQLEFEYRLSTLDFPNANARTDSLLALSGLPHTPPVVFRSPDAKAALSLAQTLRNAPGRDAGSEAVAAVAAAPAFADVTTLLDLLPARQEEKLAVLSRLRTKITPDLADRSAEPLRSNLKTLLESWPDRPLGPEDLPRHYQRQFVGDSSVPGVFTYAFLREDPRTLGRALQGLESLRDLQPSGVRPGSETFGASGWPLIYADLLRAMVPDTKKALAWGFLAMGLLLLVDTRSLRATLGLLLPAVLTLAWTLGALRWLDIRLNPFNLVAFPIALSFATLNSLLLYHRFREEGLDSFPLVLRRTALPLALSAIAVTASFIPFIPSESGGLASLGWTALISLTAAWMSSLLAAAGSFPGWKRR